MHGFSEGPEKFQQCDRKLILLRQGKNSALTRRTCLLLNMHPKLCKKVKPVLQPAILPAGWICNLLPENNSCSSDCFVFFVNLLRKEGRSSGLAVHPQVIKVMRVSLLGMSAGRLSRLVSGRIPRSTLNMICMGLVTSAQWTHTHTDTHRSAVSLVTRSMKMKDQSRRVTEQNETVTNQHNK